MSFESVRQQYAALRRQFAAGEITYQQLQDHLVKLIVRDRDGNEWRIDPGSGEWLRHGDQGWVEDEPSRDVLADAEILEQADDEEEPQQVSGRGWLAGNWGWVAMVVAGIAFIGAAAFLLFTLLRGEISPSDVMAEVRESASPTPQGVSTSVPVDISVPPTSTPTPTPAPEAEIVNEGHPMVLVPAGTFVMGSTDEDIGAAYALCESMFPNDSPCGEQGFEAETPAHEVYLDAYYIDLYEVTNQEFADFLNESDNQVEGGVPWLEVNDDQVRIRRVDGVWEALPDYSDHPVTEVTWHGAQAYCRARGGRLPTEAEWEKAARWNPDTGEETRYPWGNQAPDASLANFGLNVGHTVAVGSYPEGRSPLGLYDMAGNVFEWVSDWYDAEYYADSPAENPQGPDSGTQRVVRGGSWGDFSFLQRSTNRGALGPEAALNFIGFRCVLEPDALSQ
jgi:sulfatase modifying factor 1